MEERKEKQIDFERDKAIQAQVLRQEATFTFDRGMILRERAKERALKIAIYTFLIVTAMPIFLGYAWIFVASFSKELTWGIIPNGLTIKHWRFLWQAPNQVMPIVWPVLLRPYCILNRGSLGVMVMCAM